jgi:2-polyprenyl-3-methyl-5-hydroxy-6-metoxy-1,4-benzoquinol methylase
MGYEQAVAAYRVALRGAHADRIDILIELGEAQLYAGDLDGARETCAKAARLAQDAGRAEGLARAALGMGTGLGGFEVRLYDEHQIALLEQALGLLPNEDSPLRAAVLARLSVAYSQGQISGMIFGAGLGLFEIAIVCLGVRLGLYRALAEIGPSTSATLASVTDLDERYIREWLQAQAGRATSPRMGQSSPRHDSFSPTARTRRWWMRPIRPLLIEAFRTGDGVPYAAYGTEAVTVQAARNRPAYVNSLVAQWLSAIPDIAAQLADATRPARVADLCCGVGWSTIELAKAYPHLRIDGLDGDETSIAAARRNAEDHGVAARVNFEVRDISTPGGLAGHYDIIMIFEAVHDLAHPVEALGNIRAALTPGATLLVMDERITEEWTAPGDEVDRFFANASVLWCLPQGRTDATADPVGALLRPAKLRELAERAGYSRTEVAPIDHPFFRFYRLHP